MICCLYSGWLVYFIRLFVVVEGWGATVCIEWFERGWYMWNRGAADQCEDWNTVLWIRNRLAASSTLPTQFHTAGPRMHVASGCGSPLRWPLRQKETHAVSGGFCIINNQHPSSILTTYLDDIPWTTPSIWIAYSTSPWRSNDPPHQLSNSCPILHFKPAPSIVSIN